MNINDKTLLNLIKDSPSSHSGIITSFALDNKNINTFNLKSKLCDNIEYLSLSNNFLKDISFIKNLPRLFYLDIRKNPIEDYEIFNTKNTFGFLGLSTEKYFEKKILGIKRINVGILNLLIEDETLQRNFLMSNPHVIKFNDDIIYYFQEWMVQQISGSSLEKKLSSKILPMQMQSSSEGFNFNLNSNFTKKISTETLYQVKVKKNHRLSIQDFPPSFSSMVKPAIFHDKLADMLAFFEEYSKEVGDYLKSGNNNLSESIGYLNCEKKRMIQLVKIYEYILSLANSRFFDGKNVGKTKSQYPYCNLSMVKMSDVSLQIVILTILILYILHLIPRYFAIVIFKYIFKHFLNTGKEIDLQGLTRFFDLDIIYHIGIYFDAYEHFLELCKKADLENKNGKNSFDYGRDKYELITQNLKMLQIVLHCNILKAHHAEVKELFSNESDYGSRKAMIHKHIITFLSKVNIFHETLHVIQFLGDFLIYNKFEERLIKDSTMYYRIFLEVRENMFNHASKIMNHPLYASLSDKKFTETSFKRMGNRFYFKNHPVKSEQKSDNCGVFDFLADNNKFSRNKKLVKALTSSSILIIYNKINLLETTSISQNDLDSLLMATKIEFHTAKKKSHQASAYIGIPRAEVEENSLKCLLEDNIVKYHPKIILKTGQSNFNKKFSKLPTPLKTSNTTGINFKSRVQKSTIGSIPIIPPNNFKFITYPNKPTSLKRFTFLKNFKKPISSFEDSENEFTPLSSQNKTFNKPKHGIYDFKLNLRRLTHHWNEKNPMAQVSEGNKNVGHANEENDIYISPEDFCKLVSIEAIENKIKSKSTL